MATRILGLHFAAVGSANDCTARPSNTVFSVELEGYVRAAIRAHCLQFEMRGFSQAIAEQTVKNLLYLADVIELAPEIGKPKHPTVGVDLDENDDGKPEDAAGEGDPEAVNRPLW